MKIYTLPQNTRTLKIVIAADICGIPIEIETQEKDEIKKPEYLKLNPNGKSPVLVTSEGAMFESNAILRYIARLNPSAKLYGKNFLEAAEIDRWMDWYNNVIEPLISDLRNPIYGRKNFDKKVYDNAMSNIQKELVVLNDLLIDNTYIMGDIITIADLYISTSLYNQYATFFYPEYMNSFPNINRWYNTIANQELFLKYHKAPIYCDKPFDPSTLTSNKTNEKKGDKKGGKKTQEKKEEKKEEIKEIKIEDEEEKPKKTKNPLDDLPKSSMDLDNWKRTYSNYKESDFYGVMKLFYEQYDKDGYSIWLCDYKYDDENTVGFKTSNLVGGFIQRTDSLRKYIFGNMVILKKQGIDHFFVKGGWLIRGQNIEPMIEANPDAEYYQWTKLDINNDEQKQKLSHYWCGSDNIDDYIVHDTMVFK